MNNNSIAEIYLSFAAVFHRPKQNISDHLEDLIDIWAEEISGIECLVQELRTFCSQFPPGEERLNTLWEHYIPLFETGAVEASPYASVYFEEDGLVLGKEAFSVKQFYATCGYVMGESKELPDHLAVELEFCSLLAQNGENEKLNLFERRHLNPFLQRVLPRIINSNRPFYAEAAAILKTQHLNLTKEGDFVG